MYYDIFTDSVETKYSTHYLAYGDGVIPKYEAYIGHSPIKKVFNVGSPKEVLYLKVIDLFCMLRANG